MESLAEQYLSVRVNSGRFGKDVTEIGMVATDISILVSLD
jgi:hypothetical protein